MAQSMQSATVPAALPDADSKDRHHSDCESVASTCSCASSSGSCSLCESDSDGTLPNEWARAHDDSGHVYYWHQVTRERQWRKPSKSTSTQMHVEKLASLRGKELDAGADRENVHGSARRDQAGASSNVPQDSSSGAKSISGWEPSWTPTNSLPMQSPIAPSESGSAVGGSSQSSERRVKSVAKQRFDLFRTTLSECVVQCLMPYKRDDCRRGRIQNNDDFKHLARKITHAMIDKHCGEGQRNEQLEFTDALRSKTKDFVKSFMKRYKGANYERN